MGEGYGCSKLCSTLATTIKFIHSCCCTTSDTCKEAFLYIRLRVTPLYSIDRSQRTVHNSWVIMHAFHVIIIVHRRLEGFVRRNSTASAVSRIGTI